MRYRVKRATKSNEVSPVTRGTISANTGKPTTSKVSSSGSSSSNSCSSSSASLRPSSFLDAPETAEESIPPAVSSTRISSKVILAGGTQSPSSVTTQPPMPSTTPSTSRRLIWRATTQTHTSGERK
ncbi:hypothetical protein Vafri_4326 [Volvox africanus]|uniref:Uncharacterized protein n=1 Tax=Volvox africanus TaxID=51714 RepID=A0A8J4ATV3_9CHLO|nr:hypothetical protein Vafri_4326 [Volvox africanus]